MNLMRRIVFAFLLVGLITGCNKNSNEGRIVVRLTDSPGDYEKVNIDLKAVQIHRSNSNDESGWITLNTNEGIYDLLELTDNVTTVIADDYLPAGQISQMRLVLGENNSVVIGGEEIPLATPSQMQTGLKLLVNTTLTEGITYAVLLDFDAAKSIVRSGNGTYNLKPVLKTVTEARDGAIEGTVLPSAENVAVYAMQGEDTIATSYAIENNNSFFVGGLEAGSYNLVFDPGTESNYAAFTIEGVNVSLGIVTNAGETTLLLK